MGLRRLQTPIAASKSYEAQCSCPDTFSAKTNMAFILAESTAEVVSSLAFGLPQKSG
jgi:hypothetical protein